VAERLAKRFGAGAAQSLGISASRFQLR